MILGKPAPSTLRTSIGEIPLEEYNLTLGARSWKIRHSGAILSRDDEQRFLGAEVRLPYGIVLWPSAIALAHDLVEGNAIVTLDKKRVLELGAGTGLPGIVAATLGANVVQTDNQETALFMCKDNAARNGVTTEARAVDWTEWPSDLGPFDVILGSDILYGVAMHPHLRQIFDAALAPGGTVLLADPLRKQSFPLFEAMEAEGWTVSINKWTVGIHPPPRAIGVFALKRR